jgi:hypothetical protein
MNAIEKKANALGRAACDACWDENDRVPSLIEDERWTDSAWHLHWRELVDEGATEADRERCRAAWCIGLKGGAI